MNLPYREAARRQGISEEELLRKIVLGEVEATPVDDRRRYLVRVADAPAPPSSPARWGVRILLAVLLLLFLAGGTWGGSYFCTRCGRIQDRVKIGFVIPVAWKTSETEFSEIVSKTYRARCGHEWMLRYGSGVTFLCLRGHGDRGWREAESVLDSGMLRAAEKVDPKGAADLLRWVLGHAGNFNARCEERAKQGFESAADFREWFAELQGMSASH
jgi:hypothetical protein